MDEETIKARVKARERVHAICDLIREELAGTPLRAVEQFLAPLREVIPPVKESPRKVTIEPMTDEEAKWFGNERMPYGEFKGMRIDDIALERLAWYADQKFQGQLRRYLASRRIKAERE